MIIAGASGFLGRSLQRELIGHGHVVCTLVRRAPLAATEIEWHPDRNELSPTELAGADAVVCLSGAGIADKRWSPDYKRLLLDSRIQTNGTIAKTLAAMGESGRPATFVSASAIGYYGERGDVPLTEAASAGSGFLADLVTKWEASTRPASDAGVRVINLRTGLILAASAGLLKRLIPIFKAGIGGRLSSGQQYQSWISLADEIAAIRHVLRTAAVSGPVNLTGPEPVRNSEFSRALGQALHRPALFPAPAFGIRLVLGEFANEGALISQRVIPEVLNQAGYQFQHRNVRTALSWALEN